MTKDMDKGNLRNQKLIRASLALLVLSGVIAGWFYYRKPSTPASVITVSGRIETDDAAVAAKTSGRIREITVREGDQVTAGQLIATLEDDQVNARVEQAKSDVARADAQLERARQQVAVLQSQLEQSRLSVGQARLDADGRVAQAQARLAAAEATFLRADADHKQAQSDADRFSVLARNGDAPVREGEQARTAAEALGAAAQAAGKQVEAARGELHATTANLDNPAIRAAQVAATLQQVRQAQADILSAEAEAWRAKAQLQEAIANQRDLLITSAFDGIVATRSAEPGEMVARGTVLVTILNPKQVYLRAFIPEGEIGRVRAGQPARVYLDSNPKQPFEAKVSRIDPEASFTPENTYFQDDRMKQVVGVKLHLVDARGLAKPGMPADGEVLVEGEQWLTAKR